MYQIVNLVNGKLYIGVHKTENLEDNYRGSGKILHLAYEKYGENSFKKTILKFFDSEELMFKGEAEIVNEAFLERKDTYNLIQGGRGGFSYINSHVLTQERRSLGGKNAIEKLSQRRLKDEDFRERMIEVSRQNLNKGREKVLSSEVRAKRRETFSKIGHAQGEKNSQYNTKWITNGYINKKIKKEDSIPEGWRKGRTMKV